MSTTAAATAKALASAGIDRVFGLPGGEVLVLMDELRRAGVDFVLMRHEANAGLAAAVYGKLRRQPGVVVTTLGPGAANLMLPLSSSSLEQEPLLAISAQIPDDFPSGHTHQLLPLDDVYRPVCKYVAKLTADNVTEVVPDALRAAASRPFGATFLTLSAREAIRPANEMPRRPPAPRGAERPGARHGNAEDEARKLTDALRKAKRPLVLIGLGLDGSNADPLRQWIRAWHLPVAVTPKAKGVVDETAATFVGTIGGMAADGLMCDALKAADLLIGFGLDPVEIDKTWHAELPIHWVLEAPNAGGLVPTGAVLVDHPRLLDRLSAAAPPARWELPFEEFQRKRRAMLRRPSGSSDTMWPGDLIDSLAAVMPPEAVVTTDVGSHKFLFGQFWPSRNPETFWMSNGLSGMGYGLAAAIGAKLARPGVPVLAAVGDGGFSMNSQELETAERVGAPFVTIVLADRSYSLIKLAQETRKLEPYRMDFNPIDSVKVAEACGVAGLRTSDPDQMATAVRKAVGENRSLVVEIPINYADYRPLF